MDHARTSKDLPYADKGSGLGFFLEVWGVLLLMAMDMIMPLDHVVVLVQFVMSFVRLVGVGMGMLDVAVTVLVFMDGRVLVLVRNLYPFLQIMRRVVAVFMGMRVNHIAMFVEMEVVRHPSLSCADLALESGDRTRSQTSRTLLFGHGSLLERCELVGRIISQNSNSLLRTYSRVLPSPFPCPVSVEPGIQDPLVV
jgi:hypothetical protein